MRSVSTLIISACLALASYGAAAGNWTFNPKSVYDRQIYPVTRTTDGIRMRRNWLVT